jgi:hypothetical protein
MTGEVATKGARNIDDPLEAEIVVPDGDGDEIVITVADEDNVEVVDDVPEKDRGKPTIDDLGDASEPTEEELASYSEKVQNRIKKIHAQYNAERREREAAARVKDEAIAYAQRVHEENENLRNVLQRGDAALIDQGKESAAAKLAAAERAYRDAHESGDSDALIAAQKELNAAQIEGERWGRARPVQPEPSQAPYQVAPGQQPPSPDIDPKAAEWLRNNSWYLKVPEMTDFARSIHYRLVVEDNVDPRSDGYYEQIDTSMKEAFPGYFAGGKAVEVVDDKVDDSATRRVSTPVVAPARRSSGGQPRKVQLTASQAALARSLGIALQQYAEQLVRLQEKQR